MSTRNQSLPETLKDIVDEEVAARDHHTSDRYARKLILTDRDRQRMRSLLLEGAASPPSAHADEGYFESLRSRVHEAGRR